MRKLPRSIAPLAVTLLLLAGCTDATGGDAATDAPTASPTGTVSPSPGPITEGAVDPFSIPVGGCLAGAALSSTPDQLMNIPDEVEVIRCDRPHRTEVFAELLLLDDTYTGDEELARTAESFCYAQFTGFVGVPLEESLHDFVFLYPTEDSWNEIADRQILCLAVSPEDRTESLEGAEE
ncbi:MAG TPA: septum formation family protein [Actinomycetaceae bacterium]|nr:septum formation family protein [Actinomycetaceae bacterium]